MLSRPLGEVTDCAGDETAARSETTMVVLSMVCDGGYEVIVRSYFITLRVLEANPVRADDVVEAISVLRPTGPWVVSGLRHCSPAAAETAGGAVSTI